MAAPNLRQALIGATAAIALSASSAIAQEATSTEEIQLAQNFATPAAAESVPTEIAAPAQSGAPVVFEYGPGVDERSIASIVEIVNERGCPATASNTGLPLTVTAKTLDKSHMFDDEASAAGWALDLCKQPA